MDNFVPVREAPAAGDVNWTSPNTKGAIKERTARYRANISSGSAIEEPTESQETKRASCRHTEKYADR